MDKSKIFPICPYHFYNPVRSSDHNLVGACGAVSHGPDTDHGAALAWVVHTGTVGTIVSDRHYFHPAVGCIYAGGGGEIKGT